MKKLFLSAALLAASLASQAQQGPLWMRYPAISPDGSTIAFAYKGDLYCVPAQGGEARQLTTHAAYDSQPIWSPDGKKIAFVSTREGSMDVYVISAKGGAPTRLTTHSGKETPIAFKDNDHVLFAANIMPTAQSNLFASNEFSQVYEVSTQGGRPKLYSVLPMENISINKNGQVLYHDKKGYEDAWRKHHTSPITRDIWMLDNGKYQKLTTFKGEDRNPVWAADNQSFYYLSEQDGSFNVYRRNIASGKDTQITHEKKNPIRFLTSSDSGLLCYGFDGEIYTIKEGGQPQKVSISITTDNEEPSLIRQVQSWGATEIALSPDAKEVAFVMHGDVYVTSTEYKTTKRITDTPQQERNLSFAPDGRSLVYASERNGVWQIFQAKIKNEKEKNFTYCTDIEEEQLTKTNITSQYPAYSPDGKEVAFYEDRAALRIINLKSKEVRTVLDGKYNFSYADGDIWFEWSPDSKWIMCSYIGTGGWNNTDIAVVKADGKEVHNVTDSGYSDGNGKWVLGGKAMLFESDRAGYRSHGSWGAENDAYLMFFDLDAYDRFRMSKEELELAEANKDLKEKNADEKEEKKKEEKKVEKKKETPKEVKQEKPKEQPKEKTEAEKRAEAEKAAAAAASSKIAGAFGKGTQMGNKGTGTTGSGLEGSPTGNSSEGKSGGVGGYGTFDLNGRSLGSGGLPMPVYNVQDEGRVVVTITVNPAGQVISTSINKRTNTVNASLRKAAEEAARKARFNQVDGVNNQTGTITYYFKLK